MKIFKKKLKLSYDGLNYEDYLETTTKLLRIAPKNHILLLIISMHYT